ncbi:MAG: pyridoxine 5'-phosphate synthase [Deltaproteobacteria bacterium]|nr:pyridoxine 5'-phosphate synthase [Deltaproteobacteria bacterium]
MARLGVNIDHVATLRQARGTKYPDPAAAAVAAEKGGADQITVHLREDRRHIQDHDVRTLRHTVQTELNLEMAVTDEMIKIALDVRPNTVTFVPEKRKELTTEGGLDVRAVRKKLKKQIEELKKGGIRVSLFIDPDLSQVEESRELGADAIEIHTGQYADAKNGSLELERIRTAALKGKEIGLYVAAGHGLHYQNTKSVAAIREIEEFNIGHAIVARAIFVGFEQAVREMRELVR